MTLIPRLSLLALMLLTAPAAAAVSKVWRSPSKV